MEQNNETAVQLTVIDRSLETFKGGSAILSTHQDRALKAIAVGNKLLAEWVAADAIEDEDARFAVYGTLDVKSNDHLVKCNNARTQMEDARKPITQLMTMIQKMYVEEESKMDPNKSEVPKRIQQNRNSYSSKLALITERKRLAAEAKAKKDQEYVEIVANINNQLAQGLLNYTSTRKQNITNSFNAITLETYEEKSGKLYRMKCDMPEEAKVISLNIPIASRHTDAEVLDIKTKTVNGYNYDQFALNYEKVIRDLKESLVARMPAKKQELQEAEDARILEEKRLAEKAKNDQLLADAKNKKDREAAQLRQKQLEEDQRLADEKRIRDENDRKLREAENQKKLDAEKVLADKQLQDLKDLEIASGTAGTLFTQMESMDGLLNTAPAARTGFKITVSNPAGWVELFTFWYQREGCKLSLDELERKTFLQVKTFCENARKKDNDKIDSVYLQYTETMKAINKKPK